MVCPERVVRPIQSSSLAKPLFCVQSAFLPALGECVRTRPISPGCASVSLDRYPRPTASFATGTPVGLLPENCIGHNHKYFVLCIEVDPSRCRMVVSPCAGRGCRFALKHNSRRRLPTVSRNRPCLGRRIDRGLDQPELYRTGTPSGYVTCGGILLLHSQPQAPPLSPLLDSRLGHRLPQLSPSGTCAR